MFEGLIAVAILLVIFGSLTGITLGWVYMSKRSQIRLKELEVERLGALARLVESTRRTGGIPDIVDRDDPEALEDWHRAQAEADELADLARGALPDPSESDSS